MPARSSAKLKVLSGTPRQHGFSMPPEWAPQSGTWFSWPRPEGISFPGKYHTVPANIAAIIREIVPHQLVHINVPNENYKHIVTRHLVEAKIAPRVVASRVRFHFIPTNEAWCRDHGPAFVLRERGRGGVEAAIVDWGFNAWGGKYPPYDSDDNVPTRIAQELAGTKRFAGVFYPKHEGTPVIMEGGAVEFSGAGVVMTSEHCLLNKNRNPRLSKAQVEHYLREYYGQEHVVWLGDGIVGDDTDGHIDDLARFVAPSVVVTTVEEDPRDANYKILKDNLRRLELARDAQGKPFRVVTIPMPGKIAHKGERLPATYANFLFINNALLVPTFGNASRDRRALSILQETLDSCGHRRKVVGIDCSELIWGLGAIHCLTQQQPRF